MEGELSRDLVQTAPMEELPPDMRIRILEQQRAMCEERTRQLEHLHGMLWAEEEQWALHEEEAEQDEEGEESISGVFSVLCNDICVQCINGVAQNRFLSPPLR